MISGNIICLFASYPSPGKVGTGLEKLVGKKQAAFLARAFLMDTISTCLKVPRSELYIAHSSSVSREEFANILYLFAVEEKNKKIAKMAESINFIPQVEGDIGHRLSSASKHLFESGAKKVIFVGCDSPLINSVVLRASFKLLSDHQAVLGPTFDGAYYLIGADKHYPQLFEGVNWDASGVYKETVVRLSGNGLRWQELELSYDVAGPDELEQLYLDIDNYRLTGENEIAYHTERCLQSLEK